MSSFPYIARSIKKYRSPHSQDLSFPKGAVIRVLSLAPKVDAEDDEEEEEEEEDTWFIGELIDGSAKGTFPGTCVVAAPEEETGPVSEQSPTFTVEQTSLPSQPEQSATVKEAQPESESQSVEAPSVVEAAATVVAEEAAPEETITPASSSLPRQAPQEGEEPGAKEPTHTPATAASSRPAEDITPTTSAKEAGATAASPSKSGPPPPKPKPSGLAARIAAFNQPAASQAAPPPLLPRGGKPSASTTGGWKRPQPKEGEKPVLPGAPPALAAKPVGNVGARSIPQITTERETPSVTEGDNDEGRDTKSPIAGFSAADAASSIKLSLKERMAALQRGGGSGGDGEVSGASPASPSGAISSPPLASKPGRLTADRRAAALAGMGVGGGGNSSEGLLSGGAEGVTSGDEGMLPSSDATLPSTVSSMNTTDDTEAEQRHTESNGQPSIDVTADVEGPEEATKLSAEEEEAQRRAAIAQRLARLGGQRVGGQGPPVFGAPRPPPTKKTSTSSNAEAASDPLRSSVQSQPEPQAEQPIEQEDEKPKTLEVPRRAAPPRKKRSAASPASHDTDSLPSPQGSTDQSPGDVKEGDTTAETQDSILARAGSPLPPVTNEPDALTEHAAEKEGSSDPSAILSSADTELPESPIQPQEDVPEGFSEPPPEEHVQGQESIPAPAEENIKAVEQDSISESGAGKVAHGDYYDDAALRAQAARLEAFLAGPDEHLEDQGRLLGVDEDGDSHSIPSPLARQLGLTPPTRRSKDSITEPFVDEPLAVEGGQHQVGEAFDEIRGATPASIEPEASGSSRPPSTRPRIPLGQRPASRASLGGPPMRDAPTPPVPTPAPPASQPSQEGKRGSVISIGRPPVPRSPPPRAPSVSIGETLDSAIEDPENTAGGGSSLQTGAPALAAPLARRAVPLDEDEDEDEDDENETGRQDVPKMHTTGVTDPLAESSEPQGAERKSEDAAEAEEPAELSPEQEEAARRAAIAKRMAALGGHRMGGMPPIMGAPMPSRKKTVEAVVEADHGDTTQTAPSPRKAGPPRGGMAIPGMTRPVEVDDTPTRAEVIEEPEVEEGDDDDDEPAVAEKEPIAAIRSPPVKPTSPPPIPSAAKRHSLLSEQKPMSPPPLPPSNPDQPQRRTSLGRPPIPVTAAPPPPPPRSTAREGQYGRQASIESSLSGAGGYGEEEGVIESGEEEDQPEAVEDAPIPPPIPTSLPPRAPPPRAPPSAPAPAVQQEVAIDSSSFAPSESSVRSPTVARTSFSGPTASKSSSRDLDLAPHTRWWRGGGVDPLRLPPSISHRPDAIYYVESPPSTQIGEHRAAIKILFEDHSMTTVRVSWFDGDDEEERETTLEQEHTFPPARPSVEALRAWSGSVGVDLAQRALLILQSSSGKSNTSSGGGGFSGHHQVAMQVPVYPHSQAFVSHLIHTSRSACLPPVGSSFGPTILSQVGQTVLDRAGGAGQGGGEPEPPRPGDVLLLQGPAEFKGKKVLVGSSYHSSFGSTHVPLFAVVVEVEMKNKKGSSNNSSSSSNVGGGGGGGVGGVGGGGIKQIKAITLLSHTIQEVSLKLDDLKAGVCKIMRVPRRGEWVKDW